MSNKSFSGNYQIAWDSTALGMLKECPRKYYYSMIEEWGHKRTPLPLQFGILYHSALELYDKRRTQGWSHQDALRDAVRATLEWSGTRDENRTWHRWQTDDTARNLENLVRTIIWYAEQFQDDAARTVQLENGEPAVEMSFRMELPLEAPTGDPYLLCGHMDRLVEFQDSIWVMDRKSTKTTLGDFWFKQWSPDNQMSLYALASKVVYKVPAAGVIIDGAQVGVNFSRFARGFAHRTQAQLDEWLDDTLFWIKMAERFVDEGHWPQNDKACHHYGGCPFREVCGKDPSVRKAFLGADFERKVWDPLETR